MKVLDTRFFVGVSMVAVGLAALGVSLLALSPPNNTAINIAVGIILALTGLILTKYGLAIARDTPTHGSKIAIDMLRRAKMLGEIRKH